MRSAGTICIQMKIDNGSILCAYEALIITKCFLIKHLKVLRVVKKYMLAASLKKYFSKS